MYNYIHNKYNKINTIYLIIPSISYPYSNEVGYTSPYVYSPSVTQQNIGGYDISADYVDSTTAFEPRSTIIDTDFIGGHSECFFILFV